MWIHEGNGFQPAFRGIKDMLRKFERGESRSLAEECGTGNSQKPTRRRAWGRIEINIAE
jgi:hypothetical protein